MIRLFRKNSAEARASPRPRLTCHLEQSLAQAALDKTSPPPPPCLVPYDHSPAVAVPGSKGWCSRLHLRFQPTFFVADAGAPNELAAARFRRCAFVFIFPLRHAPRAIALVMIPPSAIRPDRSGKDATCRSVPHGSDRFAERGIRGTPRPRILVRRWEKYRAFDFVRAIDTASACASLSRRIFIVGGTIVDMAIVSIHSSRLKYRSLSLFRQKPIATAS